jgi:hypothetical protein
MKIHDFYAGLCRQENNALLRALGSLRDLPQPRQLLTRHEAALADWDPWPSVAAGRQPTASSAVA